MLGKSSTIIQSDHHVKLPSLPLNHNAKHAYTFKSF